MCTIVKVLMIGVDFEVTLEQAKQRHILHNHRNKCVSASKKHETDFLQRYKHSLKWKIAFLQSRTAVCLLNPNVAGKPAAICLHHKQTETYTMTFFLNLREFKNTLCTLAAPKLFLFITLTLRWKKIELITFHWCKHIFLVPCCFK